MDDIEDIIRKYIVNKIMFNKDESFLKIDDLLLEKGLIDSLGLQMLVPFLEKEFNISISDDEIVPENFETIKSISNLVKKLRNVP